MKAIKGFFWRLVDAIPTAIVLLVVAVLLVAFYREGPSLDNLLAILNIVIWPFVVLVALLFFRRVFTFFFFSLEEFNFFGAKGKLKNVPEMIREKADELWQKERLEKAQAEEREKNQKELADLKGSHVEARDHRRELIKFAERLIEDKSRLQSQNSGLKAQVDLLQTQLALVQGKTPENPTIVSDIVAQAVEEAKDVGTVNPQSANSEAPTVESPSSENSTTS